jgi:hypothetical protein
MRLSIAAFLFIFTTPVYAQTIGSSSGAAAAVNINSPGATTNHLVTTPTVAAPGLAAAGLETCLGSSAGGLSLMGGGFTFGSTKVDEGCTIRLLARQLYAFGFQKAALAMMCEDDHVVIAMAEVGSPCPVRPVQVQFSDDGPRKLLHEVGQLFRGEVPGQPEPAEQPVQVSEELPVQNPVAAHAQKSARRPVQESAQRQFHLALAPEPSRQEEQPWFDRPSNMN